MSGELFVRINLMKYFCLYFCFFSSRQVSGELFALTTKYYPYNSNSNSSSSSVPMSVYQPSYSGYSQSPQKPPPKVINSWDIDMDYNAQPNYIPRSRRNPFLEDYMMTTLKY